MYSGRRASSIPLIHVDVLPRRLHDGGRPTDTRTSAEPSFLAASIKIQLLKDAVAKKLSKNQGSEICLTLDVTTEGASPLLERGYLSTLVDAKVDANTNKSLPVLFLPQNDVTLPSHWPCECYGYCSRDNWPIGVEPNIPRVHVTEATTIRVLPPCISACHNWERSFTGEIWEDSIPSGMEEEITTNHNPETIRELSLRLKTMWARRIRIGNTPDALHRLEIQNERRSKFSEMFQGTKVSSTSSLSLSPRNLSGAGWCESTLIVHSPDHGAGKSLLVQSLVRQLEPHSRVYVIRCGLLLGKFGIAADAVLESALHQAVYSAALEDRPVCILLDDLDVLLTPLSPSSGDAAMPVLNGITAYLRILTRNLRKGTFLYPNKNPLYNVCGERGRVFAARLCLVGVITCRDDEGKTRMGNSSEKRSLLDYLDAGKYRLPSLTASTRLTAFRAAIDREGVSLADDAEKALPRSAASAVWARGSTFRRIVKQLPTDKCCTAEDLHRAFDDGRKPPGSSANVSFECSTSNDFFGSVGGNADAKLALYEALSLDPDRRKLLASFGLTPPTGVMLYGPPGCGKTLLAKAVARILQRSSVSSVGGAFVSLNSSDIVHAEVGAGEKLLVSAFETARMNSPSVVFIDEFQALFTDRSSGGSSRFSSTLLTLLDDIRSWESADKKAVSPTSDFERVSPRVVVLAATNTPWMIDTAFLRPGRFDHVVHVGLPDLAGRQSIFELLISQMKTSLAPLDRVVSFSEQLAQATAGYSGADISVVCRTAAVDCLVANEDVMTEKHFRSALDQVKASSSSHLVSRIEKWKP